MSLSDWADLANVLVAGLAFLFSLYTYKNQKDKDRESQRSAIESESRNQLETEKLRTQNIRLQWYKDVVITPNIDNLNQFYRTLSSVRDQITTPDVADEQKDILLEAIKEAQRSVRVRLVDLILPISPDLHSKVLNDLDHLVDCITNAVYDDTLKLSNQKVSDTYISKPIHDSKQTIFTLIYSYRGE